MTMRAVICDKCGKVMLLADKEFYPEPGYHLISSGAGRVDLDLCDECADELIAAVRDQKEG